MSPINTCIAALAVAIIFYIYRGYVHVLARKQRTLRQRVAYLLWVAAERAADRNKTITVS